MNPSSSRGTDIEFEPNGTGFAATSTNGESFLTRVSDTGQKPWDDYATKARAIMNQNLSFDTLAEALVPDENQAMILVQERAADDGQTAMGSLRALAGNRTEFKKMNDEPPLIYLVSLPAELLHEAVLKLTEQGVTRLKAVQPVSLKAPPGMEED